MISGIRKIPVLRYFLIILLFIGLFLTAEFLYLHYERAQKLRSNIENVISARENSALIDSCIINLYSADNNSRLYTITGNKRYLNKFSHDIDDISNVINKIKFNKEEVAEENPEKFRQLMKQKTEKTGSYIKLRLLTDSLIKSSMRISNRLNHFQQQMTKQQVKVEHKVVIDTVKNTSLAAADAPPHKKLLGRIFSAFKSKKKENTEQHVAAPVVVKTDTVTYTEIIPKTKLRANRAEFNNYYNKLNAVNNKLRTNERQILLINNNLVEEIIASLKLYKSVEQQYIENSKVELQENLANVFTEFRQVSTINFFFLFTLIVIVLYNIWKIFRNEQKLIDYSEKAEEYAQLKSRFLAGMSHEIRTPLNSVIGFSEQLGQEELTPVQKEQIDAIRTSSEILLDLVNEILDFSKYETGKMNFESAPFNVHHVLEEVYTTMHIHAVKKHIALDNEIFVANDLCCEGDKMRLKQVIMNLIGNAIKFTVKGKVTLNATIEKGAQDDDTLMLKIKIKDTGLGIDIDDLPHIFDEFSQVAKAQKATRHKGTGLGLAICKKIIELQGGTINATSVPGQGSVFSFQLPLKQLENRDCLLTQTISDDLMADLVKDRYVLFTEDNKLNVLLGTTILKKWKIRYDIAYNGMEAFQLFEQNNYDMVLTDIQMPEMDGLQLTHLIRNEKDPVKSSVPIMALTANVLKEDRDLYLNTGINDVILKPFLEKDLIGKISLAIQNKDVSLRYVD